MLYIFLIVRFLLILLLKKKIKKQNTDSTVLFVPCTPRSRLARRLKEVEVRGREDRGWSVKVMEMGGQTLRSQLSKPNPRPNATCGDAKCFLCREETGGGTAIYFIISFLMKYILNFKCTTVLLCIIIMLLLAFAVLFNYLKSLAKTVLASSFTYMLYVKCLSSQFFAHNAELIMLSSWNMSWKKCFYYQTNQHVVKCD